MEIKLHANATTTPRVRRYIQQSEKSDRVLAQELGISVATVRRWRQRQDVSDRQTTPKTVRKVLSQQQSMLINWMRQTLSLPLDELLVVVNQGMQQPVSRAALDRYLRGVTPRADTEARELRGKKGINAGHLPGRLHLFYQRLNLLAEEGGEWHILWAQESVSGWVAARAYAGVSPVLLVNWLTAVVDQCPGAIQSIETENKSVFGHPGMVEHPLSVWCSLRGIHLERRIEQQIDRAVRLDSALSELCPSAVNLSLDELLQDFCRRYNLEWPQKKLGGETPAVFWLKYRLPTV